MSKVIRVGYLGPEFTFSYIACLLKYRGRRVKFVPMLSFRDIVEGIINGTIDEGMLPVENSILGCVGSSLDAIIAGNGKIFVRDEFDLPISHCLVASRPDIKLEEITRVITINEIFGQCQSWIQKNIPENAIKECVKSSATAVQDLNSYSPSTVVIGPELAVNKYGGHIIERDIQDAENVATHFLVLGSKDVKRQEGCITSLIFLTSDGPGSLVDSLDVFRVSKVNMVKIEQRPTKNKLREYIFWVDIEGHRLDSKIKAALELFRDNVKHLKVLGSYPRKS